MLSSLILILFPVWIPHTQIKALFCPPSLHSAKMMFFSFQDFCYFHFTDQFLSVQNQIWNSVPQKCLCFVMLESEQQSEQQKSTDFEAQGNGVTFLPHRPCSCVTSGESLSSSCPASLSFRMGCSDRAMRIFIEWLRTRSTPICHLQTVNWNLVSTRNVYIVIIYIIYVMKKYEQL